MVASEASDVQQSDNVCVWDVGNNPKPQLLLLLALGVELYDHFCIRDIFEVLRLLRALSLSTTLLNPALDIRQCLR